MDNRHLTYDSAWDRLSTAGKIAVGIGVALSVVLPAVLVFIRIVLG